MPARPCEISIAILRSDIQEMLSAIVNVSRAIVIGDSGLNALNIGHCLFLSCEP